MYDRNKSFGHNFSDLVLGFPVAIFLTPISILHSLFYAWILTYLWSWYITFQFGIRELKLSEAFGFFLIWGFLQTFSTDSSVYVQEIEDDFTVIIGKVLYKIPIALLVWFTGWAYYTLFIN